MYQLTSSFDQNSANEHVTTLRALFGRYTDAVLKIIILFPPGYLCLLFDPEDGGSAFPRIVNKNPPGYSTYLNQENSVAVNAQAIYTDRSTASGRRSNCQFSQVEGCSVVSATGPHSR
jgi:hypothetical protein